MLTRALLGEFQFEDLQRVHHRDWQKGQRLGGYHVGEGQLPLHHLPGAYDTAKVKISLALMTTKV